MSSQIEVSIVLSSRDEFPNVVHTVHSIVNDLETFLNPDQFEIIIVDNGSKDPNSWRFLAERGMFYHRTVKIVHDPIFGNVTARNKGAEIAQGKFLFFSDSHMSYKIGSFEKMVEAIKNTGGIVHPAVQWMGGYEPSDPSYQYTIKLGEKVWGTWNKSVISTEHPFFIPVSGHCCLGMRRDQFLDFGGYNDWFRCYGGGELYLDLKWWMMGSTVASVPDAVGYHLSAGRGYSFVQNDLIHNMMLMSLALGADAFAERVYIRYMSKAGVHMETLTKMYEDAKREAESDRSILLPKCVMTFYEMLEQRPWDVYNENNFGSSNSFIGIYDKTWLDELDGEAKSFYDNSPLQKELRALIDSKFSHMVYTG